MNNKKDRHVKWVQPLTKHVSAICPLSLSKGLETKTKVKILHVLSTAMVNAMDGFIVAVQVCLSLPSLLQ